MGNDPSTSALNPYCQTHEVKNLFVTDGGPFVSQADKNPTWTILALSMRASDYIVRQRKAGAHCDVGTTRASDQPEKRGPAAGGYPAGGGGLSPDLVRRATAFAHALPPLPPTIRFSSRPTNGKPSESSWTSSSPGMSARGAPPMPACRSSWTLF